MLSRVADSAFWMSRYVERAEDIARIVDVNLQLMLDLPTHQAEAISKNWLPVVASLGDELSFTRSGRAADARTVTEYLVFDGAYSGSILACLAGARENARTIREQITTEMWEQINRTHLWLTSKGARQFFERNAYEFFQRVKKSLQLFQGITNSVMLRGEGWEFIQLGKYLERADKTSRLLDDKFFLLPPSEGRPVENLPQWHSILRSCNARQTYQRLYAAVVEPIKVAELLLLNTHFPRSVQFCVYEVDQSLRRVSGMPSGRFSNLAEKLSGRLLSEMSFSSIEDLWERGLHGVVDEIQAKLNAIGAAVRETYTDPVPLRVAPTSPQMRLIPQ